MHDEWIAFPRRYLSEGSMAAVYAGESAGNTTHELPNTPNTTPG
jgi:putative transposase